MRTFLLASTMMTLAGAAQAQAPLAPAGAANAPNLLSGYANRPSWQVAGVDYHVGAPDGVTLKDPTTAPLPAGCAYASNTVTCNGSNVQLSGYDFATHGTQLALNGGGTISGNTFAMTSCQDPLVSLNGTQSVAFTANTVTGNGGQCSSLPWGTLVNAKLAAGTKLITQYNAFNNVPQDVLDVRGPDSGSASLVDNNNFINQQGFTGHPDGLQLNGGTLSSADVSGNTYYTSKNTVAGTQPLHVEAQLGSSIANTTVNNNVVLTPGTCNSGSAWGTNACVANFDIACKNDPGWSDSNTNFTATNNYIDASGAIAPTSNNYGCSGANITGNVNMTPGRSTGGSTASVATTPPTAATEAPATPPTTAPTPAADTGQAATTSESGTTSGPQTITPGQGTLTDATGTVWAITPNGSIHNSNGWVPGGGGTSALTIINGTVYGEDAHGRGWFTLSGNDQYWSSTPTPPGITSTTSSDVASGSSSTATATIPHNTITPPTISPIIQMTTPPAPCPTAATGTGGFHVVNGQIIGPNGQPFVARGIDIMYFGSGPSVQQVQAAFPGVNYIRLAIYNYDSPQSLSGYITNFTDKGIVIEPENHNNGTAKNAGGSQGVVFTGAALAKEQAWYHAMASAFASNPYVWFGTNNEPSQNPSAAALSNWQAQTVQAIRSAGNNSIILIEMNCDAQNGCGAGYMPSIYAGMKNIVWDMHYYNWLSNYSTDQSAISKQIISLIQSAQKITSADGIVPVLIGEYGNSTDGQNIDPGGTQTVAAVISLGSHSTPPGTGSTPPASGATTVPIGSAAWAWGSGNPGDGLTNSDGTPTNPYGQMVELYANTSTVAPTQCQVDQQAAASVASALVQAQAPQTSQVAQTTVHAATTPQSDASSQSPAQSTAPFDPAAPSAAVTALTNQAATDIANADQIVANALGRARPLASGQ